MTPIQALQKIEQMSDPGSYEKAIIEMKSIATNALRLYSQSKENEGKRTGVSGEQIWKLACNELLANIAWTFGNPDNIAKADTNYDRVVFEALGETIQNFPVPKYPGLELITIQSGERGEVERLKGEMQEMISLEEYQHAVNQIGQLQEQLDEAREEIRDFHRQMNSGHE